MISVEEAQARVLALARPTAVERVALRQAGARVLAEPAVARRDQPPFDASAMDGYAIRAEDHRPGARLTVIGEAGAGRGFDGALRPGTAVRIFTGAPVPAGAGWVVLQENVTREGDEITLPADLESHDNIRRRGQDFRDGGQVAAPRLLRPADLALLAAMNIPEVTVARRPEVAILATGDELVMPGETPRPDQIIASNGFALAALAEQAGARVRMLPIARDTEASLRQGFALAEGSDLIVTIGGASVGDYDLVGPVAESLGLDRAFYKVAMRPGKPLMAGRIGAAALLGLPGNPVSSIVCGHLFLVPLIQAMQGLSGRVEERLAVLDCDMPPTGPRSHYMRARLTECDGLPRISPFADQDSALLGVLAEAQALLIRPAGDGPRKAGETARFIPI